MTKPPIVNMLHEVADITVPNWTNLDNTSKLIEFVKL